MERMIVSHNHCVNTAAHGLPQGVWCDMCLKGVTKGSKSSDDAAIHCLRTHEVGNIYVNLLSS
jgi:hypothetical protein